MNKKTWFAWLGLIVVSFSVMEYISIFDESLETSTLTSVIIDNVPSWITMPILVLLASWSIHHFASYYKKGAKGK